MEETKNPKCNRCKCYWKPDEADVKSSGLYCKTCKKCRDYQKQNVNKNKCEHNKIKRQCKECGGVSICIHNKHKSICRECDGVSICIHNKRKSYCKECGGGSICIHNKRKSQCKECYFKLYLVHLERKQINRCIKLSNLEKIKPSIEYLGCSAEYFIEYFKKKMDNFNEFSEIEMTWDNIHIDHIKPISSFNLDDEEEFLSCCHYTNLQPLIAEVNLSKKCKWSDDDDVYWLENIKNKEYYDIYIPN